MEKQKGFTILELLVVMFIVGLLSTMVFANYRDGKKQYILSQTTQQLISDLRKAQNMAISGVDIKGQYCGFGIRIDYNSDNSSYILYADVPPSGGSDRCDNTNNKYDGSDQIIETIDLPFPVEIESTSPHPIDVFFKSPDPLTYINGDNDAGESGNVVLKIQNSTDNKAISITTAGLIQKEW